VSRIPRSLEYLKTGFTAEAVSAARFRAYADQAAQDGRPNLSRRWLRLAAGKDALAVKLLGEAGQVRGEAADLTSAIEEERYENDVLYPKIVRDVDQATSDVILQVLEAQKGHLRELEELRRALTSATGDVTLPAEVDQGSLAKAK
jgi:rubrerythrin